MQRGVVQPDDVPIVVGELSVIIVVRAWVMWLKMAMDN
jgi:hypothetical protein